MKVLLINPPTKHCVQIEVPHAVNREVGRMMPMGLLSIFSYLKANGVEQAKILDAALPGKEETVKSCVKEFDPALIGITSHTHNLYDVIVTIRRIREVKPEAKIVIGGPHVNSFPHEAASLKDVDFAIQGDGEKPFLSLIKAMSDGGSPRDPALIPGLWRLDKKGAVQGSNCELIDDLDRLPFPDRNALDLRAYGYALEGGGLSATIYTAKGCPYNCRFCSTPRKPVRFRSIENVIEEIGILEKMGIKKIFILDDTFNINRARAEKLALGLIKKGMKIRWSFRARIDNLDAELLNLLKRSGCTRLQVGIETGTDEGLQILGKDLTIEKICEGIRQVRRAGIEVAGYFMLGCPNERSKADIRKTIRFAIELKLDYVLFGILTLFKGTPLYDEAQQRGIIHGDPWKNFMLNPTPDFQPPTWNEFLSKNQLEEIVNEAYKTFYLRPSYIAGKFVKATTNPRDWPLMARAALAILSLKKGHD